MPNVDDITAPRNGKGRFVPHPAVAARDSAAAHMYAQGFRLREIRDELRFGSEGNVLDAVNRAMRAVRSEGGALAKAKALARLDEMYARAREVLDTTHYVVQQGVVVHIGGEILRDEKGRLIGYEGGTPLVDDEPVLRSLHTMLRLEERRARIEGIDAPAKHRVEVSRVDDVDRAIRDLVEVMGRRDAGSRAGGDQSLA